MTDTITLSNVSKSYRLGDGSTLIAVNKATGSLPAGAFCTIMGPSGSGKSTLLHLIGALDQVDDGTITVLGTDVTNLKNRHLDDYRASTGFIFQRFHLVGSLTVIDNILLPLVPRKVDFDRRARATELINTVGLDGRSNALPHQLSGGQQQRVAIARALISDPQVLLGDEPTGNLDSTTAAAIIDLLHTINRDRGTTVLLATHDPTIAAQADHQWTITDGELG